LWYAVTSLIGLASLLPIPESPISTRRLRGFHRLSALLIVLFAMAHLSNHTFAIVSVATHTTVLDLLRVVYRQPVIETLLLAAILQQIATGGALVWQAHLRRPSMRTNLQAVSGLYMAVFFLAHVSAALMARGSTDTNFVWAAGQRGLLASRGLTFLLPYYLLGVMAIFVHVGQGLRMSVLRFMPELSVQRLSYAGVAFGGAVVVTLGLALCGVHVLP
jgi:succinate dehydrogenase/fumarate reductase cytochrome b subunit